MAGASSSSARLGISTTARPRTSSPASSVPPTCWRARRRRAACAPLVGGAGRRHGVDAGLALGHGARAGGRHGEAAARRGRRRGVAGGMTGLGVNRRGSGTPLGAGVPSEGVELSRSIVGTPCRKGVRTGPIHNRGRDGDGDLWQIGAGRGDAGALDIKVREPPGRDDRFQFGDEFGLIGRSWASASRPTMIRHAVRGGPAARSVSQAWRKAVRGKSRWR